MFLPSFLRSHSAACLASAFVAAVGCTSTRSTAPPVATTGSENVMVFEHITVVHPERVDGAGFDADQTVTITGDRIVAVGPSASASKAPAGARIVDGRGKWLVPGYVDTHVHFFQSASPYARPDVADLTSVVPYARESALNRAEEAQTFRAWLASGVTATVDVGGPLWTFEVRDHAAHARIAPEVFVAGPLLATVIPGGLDTTDPPFLPLLTPEDARDKAITIVNRKPDLLKFWFFHRKRDDFDAQVRLLDAVSKVAHERHVPMAVHATEQRTAKAALRAGARILVHSVFDEPLDEEFLSLAKANGVFYTPTLYAYVGYGQSLSGEWSATAEERRLGVPRIVNELSALQPKAATVVPQDVRDWLEGIHAATPSRIALDNLRRVREAGIAITLGTDAGNIGTVHGPSVFREMKLMELAGMSPRQVLRAATIEGARMLDKGDSFGSIAPGKRADVLVLSRDPYQSADNASSIEMVVRRGISFAARDLESH